MYRQTGEWVRQKIYLLVGWSYPSISKNIYPSSACIIDVIVFYSAKNHECLAWTRGDFIMIYMGALHERRSARRFRSFLQLFVNTVTHEFTHKLINDEDFDDEKCPGEEYVCVSMETYLS